MIEHLILYCEKCSNKIDLSNIPLNTTFNEIIQMHYNKKNCIKSTLEKFVIIEHHKILEYEKSLLIEQTKSMIFANMLEINTGVKTDELLIVQGGVINIYNSKIPVIVHSQNIVDIPKIEKPKKQVFRTIKRKNEQKIPLNDTIIVEETDNETDESNTIYTIINQKTLEFNNQKSIFQDGYVTIEAITNDIEKIFHSIKTCDVYSKLVPELIKIRSKIIGKYSIQKYVDILKSHVELLLDILVNIKRSTKSKIKKVIDSSLSPLESRIMGNFNNSIISTDDIFMLQNIIHYNTEYDTTFEKFDYTKLCNKMLNYGILPFSLRKTLERYLLNPYGYHNIIYIDLPKSKDDDPYSFYTLERIYEGIRHWKMNCRLEYLSELLSTTLIQYLTKMFRDIYKSIYGDNNFRNYYEENHQILECECNQIIKNLIILSDMNTFRNLLCSIIKENATFNFDEKKDKFNLRTDDKCQKTRFKSEKKTDPVEILKLLFDNASYKDIVLLYEEKGKM